MNIELANRLYEYRKQSGLSQEELAEKLGISRQSVSKWERAESCPDTDNLIELSKIYNVTMDELLNTNIDIVVSKEEIETKVIEEQQKYKIVINHSNNFHTDKNGNQVTLNDDCIEINNLENGDNTTLSYEELYTEIDGVERKVVELDGFGKNKKEPSPAMIKTKDIINGVLILLVSAIYVALCALEIMDWGKFWVIFVYYPAITSLCESIVHKDANKFASPVLCAAVYVTIGMYAKERTRSTNCQQNSKCQCQ